MPRDISGALLSASQQSIIQSVILVKLMFSTPVYVHSGIGDLEFDSNTYLGVGDFGSITQVLEESDLSVNSINLVLSGINTSLINIMLNQDYQGKDAIVYFALRDTSDNTLISPTIIYRGLINNSSISLSSEASILLSISNRIARWDKANSSRYSNEDQQMIFAGDVAFEFQSQLSFQTLTWGSVGQEL